MFQISLACIFNFQSSLTRRYKWNSRRIFYFIVQVEWKLGDFLLKLQQLCHARLHLGVRLLLTQAAFCYETASGHDQSDAIRLHNNGIREVLPLPLFIYSYKE